MLSKKLNPVKFVDAFACVTKVELPELGGVALNRTLTNWPG
jgi:hypothetical protein